MCGKGMAPTSSQTAAPNPVAMQAYMAGLGQITAATSKPFQRYSSDPTSYVSPLTQTQAGAIQNISSMAGMTDPYYQASAGLISAGAGPVDRLTGAQIGEYMSPYMSQVVDPVRAGLEQQFGQQLSQQQAQAIKAGAFGGSRSDVARALLQGQQGLAMGQALSPLYQTGYGQALQTAQGQQAIESANQQRMLAAGQQFGGLGSAAQQAALQQGQAQLQAGTLEQQTRNAMLQALYGEAQKERMYPLQAAQIQAQGLAGIGPLMGSTQSTSQQLPFFGGLASGGSVDAYNEGLGRARMGGAVTEEGDYARGGYAYGGYPNDLSGLVEQQRAALGLEMPREDIQVPIIQIAPSRVLQPETAPERRKGIVEQGLSSAIKDPSAVYDKAKDLYSSASKAKEVFDFATGSSSPFPSSYANGGDVGDDAMQKMTSEPIHASKPLAPQSSDQKEEGKGILGSLVKAGASMAANYFAPGSGAFVNAGLGAIGLAHGGRAGYEDGGDIYEKGILGAESGRHQFDREGRVLTSPKGALGIAQIMPRTAPEAAKLAGVPYDPDRLRLDPEYNKDLGRAYYNEQLRQFGTPDLAAAAYNAGPGRVRQALRRAEATGRDVMSFLPAETRDYVPRVMRMSGMGGEGGIGAAREDIAAMRRDISPGDTRRSMIAMYPERPTTEATGPSAGLGLAQVKDKSLLERTQEHPESVILPVLKGLGAMASSRSKYLGSALLEGLGAGAGSYMDMAAQQAAMDKTRQETATEAEETRKRSADVAQTEAMTGLLGAETGEKTLNIAGGAFKQVGNDWFVLNDRGQWVHLEKWRQEGGPLIGGAQAAAAANALAARVGSKAPAATPPAATPPAELPAEGATITAKPSSAPAAPAATQPPPMPPTTPVTITPGVSWTPDAEKLAKNEYGKFTGPGADAMKARSDQYVGQTTQGADAAISTRPMHADVAKIIAQAATQKGLNAPGVGFTATSAIVGTLNRIANAAGISGDVFGGARTQQDLSDKLNGISARLTASESGQHALGALESAIKTMPDLNKTPAASAENAADNIMNNQRAIDKLSHMRKYGSISNNRFSDADTAFNATNSAAKYNKERDAIRDLILGKIPTPEGARKDVRKASEILEKMYDPNVPAAAIDKFFKEHYGLDNMSRYFR